MTEKEHELSECGSASFALMASRTLTPPEDGAGEGALRKEKRKPRVLVVDDNADSGDLLAMVLEARGFEIATARDGLEALAVAKQMVPDVAVLDIGLPEMDGYELAAAMQADPRFRETKLVALTGYGQDSDRARAKEAGFHAHFVKPVAIDAFVMQIVSFVDPNAG